MDRLSRAARTLRDLRLSLGPDSYFQYKRRRKQEDEQVDRDRRHANEAAGRERREAQDAARERDFGARYDRERNRDVGPEPAKEVEPEP